MDQSYVQFDAIDGQDKRPMAMVTILTTVPPGSVGCAVTHDGHDGTSWVWLKRNNQRFEEKKYPLLLIIDQVQKGQKNPPALTQEFRLKLQSDQLDVYSAFTGG